MLGLSRLFKTRTPKTRVLTRAELHEQQLIRDWEIMPRADWFNYYIKSPLVKIGWKTETVKAVWNLDKEVIADLNWADGCLWHDLEINRQITLTAEILEVYGKTHRIMVNLSGINNLDEYAKAIRLHRQKMRSSVTAQVRTWKSQGVDEKLLTEVIEKVYG